MREQKLRHVEQLRTQGVPTEQRSIPPFRFWYFSDSFGRRLMMYPVVPPARLLATKYFGRRVGAERLRLRYQQTFHTLPPHLEEGSPRAADEVLQSHQQRTAGQFTSVQ